MTDPTRGVRARRGARRPGWMLLTALLVLAIAASAALVFTNRVELLKLAVILALWAAVVGAFVSVIYRRQSDVDQAKVRDLKLVYDLQLDREISARREYELSLEAQLRRELAAEVRVQAADEVAGLRAELAALRTNLEILFDADLSHRPAIENERTTVRAYSDWARDSETTGRVTSSRIHDEFRDDVRTEESPIIDVPAEPHPPEPEWAPPAAAAGAHRRASDGDRDDERRHAPEEPRAWAPAPPSPPEAPWPPTPHVRPQGVAQERPSTQEASPDWQPAPAEGHWIPAGAPGSNWVSSPGADGDGDDDGYVGRRRAPSSGEEATAEPAGVDPMMSAPPPQPRRGRHSVSPDATDPGRPPAPPTIAAESGQPATPAEPAADEDRPRRHRTADDVETGGQSVAELLARLQASPTPGGRRRRREE